ncbi:MAG: histidine phosphatase family protein [Oscillospiraceae bacterium]|nr:histidine phosphatase family protein [Oscillospiraceae bacterium]
MAETTVYLIRHAEAEGNLYRRIHGYYDSNVTTNGLRQIAALEARFRGIPVDAVYSSDLTRACRTAMAVADPKGLLIRRDPRFREISIGVWEDVPFGELEQTDAQQLYNFNGAPRSWKVEGAEDYETYTDRFLSGLEEAVRENAGGSIAIFSHGGVLSRSLSRLLPDACAGHSDNTAVTELRYDGAWRLSGQNDNSHLSPEISTLARQNWWRGDPTKVDHNLWFRPFEGEIDWYLELADDKIPVSPMASIQFAMLGQKPVGLLQLDPERGRESGYGSIDYLGLAPGYRCRELGVQMIGCAVSYFRNLGRAAIRISVPEEYGRCTSFLTRDSFRPLSDGSYEKDIRVTL